MMNNKCHNWVRLKTTSTLQSIGMNKKSMMGQVVCAVSQSDNLSCFKAETCKRSAAPTLLGLQDPVAATTSAARIRGIHLLPSVFLISSHPSLPVTVNAATFWPYQTFIFGEFSFSHCKNPPKATNPLWSRGSHLISELYLIDQPQLSFQTVVWRRGLITGQKWRKAVLMSIVVKQMAHKASKNSGFLKCNEWNISAVAATRPLSSLHPPLVDGVISVTAHLISTQAAVALSVFYSSIPVLYSPFHNSAFSLGPLMMFRPCSGTFYPHSPIPVGPLAVMLPHCSAIPKVLMLPEDVD